MLRASRTTRFATVTGAGLLAAMVLAGCGDANPPSGPTTGGAAPSDPVVAPSTSPGGGAPAVKPSVPAGPHNETDISFASSMIPHNVQALASTQIATNKAVKPQVKAEAKKIGSVQVPQIEELSAWLAGWGQPVPAGAAPAGDAKGITQADLVQLSKTAPGAFDKAWLTQMIEHQQIAVSLAQAEVAKGTNAEAKAMAQKIVKEQQAEIATMKALLKKA